MFVFISTWPLMHDQENCRSVSVPVPMISGSVDAVMPSSITVVPTLTVISLPPMMKAVSEDPNTEMYIDATNVLLAIAIWNEQNVV